MAVGLSLGIGLLAAEWAALRDDAKPAASIAAARVAAPMPGAAGPRAHAAAAGGPDIWAATILARPLFSRARRPPPPDAAVGARPPTLPRLAGLVISPGFRRAIFQAPQPNPVSPGAVSLAVKGTIDGWTVASIGKSAVTLFRAGVTRSLAVSFAMGTTAPTPPAVTWNIPLQKNMLHERW